MTALYLLLSPLRAWGSNPAGLVPGETGESFLCLNLAVPAYHLTQDKEEVTRIRVDGFGLLSSPGNPRLPRAVYTLALPPDVDIRTVRPRVLNIEVELLDGVYDIEPAPPLAASAESKQLLSWGEDKDIKEGRNQLVYESNNPYPSEPVEILSVTRLRRWVLVRVAYCPFCYYPKSGKIEVMKRIELDVQFEKTVKKEIIHRETPVDRAARSMIHNVSQAASWYVSPRLLSADGGQQYDYVIITSTAIRDNSTRLYDFKALKESFGHSVLIVTEDDYGNLTGQALDSTAEKIREWLKDNYESMGITHVLLVGDPDPSSGDVPMKMCWPRNHEPSDKEAPSDYFYADLTGNWDLDGDGFFGEYQGDRGLGGVDFDAEVWVGRIPVYDDNYAALDVIIEKIIDYQTEMVDMSWRKKALLPMAISNYAAEPEPSYPRTDGAELGEEMISGYLSDNGFVAYTLYEGEGDVPSSYSCDAPLTRSNVRDEWANGYGLVCWWGHGNQTGAYRKYWIGDTDYTPSFFQSGDAACLDNTRPSMVYHCSCLNGYPENSNSLGHVLLKQGAVATVSSSRVSWYEVGWTDPSLDYGDNASLGYYYMKNLVQGGTGGEALALAKGDLTVGEAEIWMNLQGFNLYGDPSLALVNPAPLCVSDFDEDGDVDGSNLATFAAGEISISLEKFAADFGRTGCLQRIDEVY